MGEETEIARTDQSEKTVQHVREREQFRHDMGVAKTFLRSGMFNDCNNKEQAYVKIQTGRELGMPPTTAMRRIYMVKGRATLSAETQVALVRQAGVGTFEYEEGDDWVKVVGHRTETGESYQATWSLQDAKDAGLTGKDNWKNYPKQMLRHRAESEVCRALFGDVTGGLYSPGEIEDADIEMVQSQAGQPPQSASEGQDAATEAAEASLSDGEQTEDADVQDAEFTESQGEPDMDDVDDDEIPQ